MAERYSRDSRARFDQDFQRSLQAQHAIAIQGLRRILESYLAIGFSDGEIIELPDGSMGLPDLSVYFDREPFHVRVKRNLLGCLSTSLYFRGTLIYPPNSGYSIDTPNKKWGSSDEVRTEVQRVGKLYLSFPEMFQRVSNGANGAGGADGSDGADGSL
jgi:hypothetical protein